MNTSSKQQHRERIKQGVRVTVSGTAERPRLSVFRSNRNVYAQLIDDTTGTTIAAVSDLGEVQGTKRERATAVGMSIAKLAQGKGITTIVFDRNGYRYAGRVQALAEGARAGGLTF